MACFDGLLRPRSMFGADGALLQLAAGAHVDGVLGVLSVVLRFVEGRS
jgi:hypothetical protein